VTTAGAGPRLDRAGTPESTWTGGQLEQVAELQVSRRPRAVIVAPHPDDEVLAAGGLMQRLSSGGTQLTVVSVTDGEASHLGSTTVTRRDLADRRAQELRQALDHLDLRDATVLRLALPDGAVADRTTDLAAFLGGLLGPDVSCVAPWDHDGHPDHDAAGRAAAVACKDTGATLLRYLVWTWHWAGPGDHRVPWSDARRVALSGMELTRKRSATGAFRSQIAALSDLPGDEAILDASMLAHFDRGFEVFLT